MPSPTTEKVSRLEIVGEREIPLSDLQNTQMQTRSLTPVVDLSQILTLMNSVLQNLEKLQTSISHQQTLVEQIQRSSGYHSSLLQKMTTPDDTNTQATVLLFATKLAEVGAGKIAQRALPLLSGIGGFILWLRVMDNPTPWQLGSLALYGALIVVPT